jgi:hypothetical protein
MSYSRRYHERIRVPYSGTVPHNDSDGSRVDVPYSGTIYEDVEVNINVDTNPFDRSIAGCNDTVNALTNAVYVAQEEQVISINKNAQKVAETIIEGFFKNIRYEISAQVMELSQKIDAYMMHLRELSKQLLAKKATMETDYNRTANRYVKIFDDLNNELSNRIFELEKPAFHFKQLADSQSQRTSDNDLVGTVAIAGAESGDLQARISASIAKKRTFDAIAQANIFLLKQKRLQRTVSQSMLNDTRTGQWFSPVCFLETRDENSRIGKALYQSGYLSSTQENSVIAAFQSKQWTVISSDSQEKIGRYFNAELSAAYSAADTHTARVKDMITKIFDLNSVKNV